MSGMNWRLTVAALVGGVVLVGAATALKHRGQPEDQTATQAAPTATVPGYTGPLYDAQGRYVGYAQPESTIPNAPPPDSGQWQRFDGSQPQEPGAPPQQGGIAPPNDRTALASPPAPYVATAPARRHPRSTHKSAAIVAGSAGAGAAIGAIAGGGKGAAIGALSGGAAGFVYDRATHNK